MSQLIGIVTGCTICANDFAVCQRCFRGQKYCSDSCRDEGYARNKRRTQQKYENSSKGRAARKEYRGSEIGKVNHKKRQQAYRRKTKWSTQNQSDTMISNSFQGITNFRDAEYSSNASKLVFEVLSRNATESPARCSICKIHLNEVFRNEWEFFGAQAKRATR